MNNMIIKNSDLGLLILRLSTGMLMLFHGIAKLNGITFIETMLSEKGLPAFLSYGVFITEILAPILIIVGYKVRLASLIYAFGVIFAILLVHSADIFTLNQFGGWGIELLGLYLFSSVTLIFTGAGKYAISSKNQWD